MKAIDYARSVRHTLVANRLRAALTLLGTVIGAASIVLLAGLLRGGEEMMIASSQDASESDLVRIVPDKVGDEVRQHHVLGRADQALIESSPVLPGVTASSESQRELLANPVQSNDYATGPDTELHVRLVSADPGTLTLYHLSTVRGRAVSNEDVALRSRICVVGWDVWRRLFGEDAQLTSQKMRIDGHVWDIVGVLKSKSPPGGGGDGTWMWNRKVLVPQTTFDAMFATSHTVDRIYVRLSASKELAKKMEAVEGVLRAMLMRTHGVANFIVEAENSSGSGEKLILSIIEGLLMSTALLSLLVGGINIMNIMLVTVTERTREIGVRRAIGATPRAIWIQFLLEATFIAGVGGIIGVVSGVALTWLIARAMSHQFGTFAFHVESWSVMLGLGLSLSTGMIFGLFPAVRASRLDPVEALRFE